jgi:T5SS/PEP-CTERM-associated repeat protein
MNRRKTKFQFIAYIICSVIIATITANPATASITTTGDIDPTYTGLDPWIILGDLSIGITSDANMVISDGSMVINVNGLVGYWSNSTGTVTVTGQDSHWGNSNLLSIGESGDADMVVSDGAEVINTYSRIATWADSTSTVTVTGPNSIWDGGQFYFGYYGDAYLLISDGGTVKNTYGYIASMQDSASTVEVTGPNSLWEIQGNLSLGTEGGDATLLISDGGRVTDANAYIGHDSSGTGHVTVTGPDSLWENANNLYVGYDGEANLLITDGGKVSDANGYTSFNSTSVGNATVTGPNSLWENSNNLYIGYSGNSILDISDGGKVTNSSGYIGYNVDGIGTLNITDTNSLWESSNDLYAGYNGIANVNISKGGRVINTNGYVAYKTDSEGTVTITGPNSLWESTQNFHAGYGGDVDMVITDGGKVMDVNGYIGYQTDGFGNIIITGANSLWENSNNFFAGYSGDANMVISDGGCLTNTNGYIGYDLDATSNINITGPNSLWNSSNNLYIGYIGDANVIITDGGKITNTNAYIGYEPDSVSTVKVDGTDSIWENSGNLYVGYNGNASMTISDGARVTNSSGYIGSESDGIGDVTVNGPNSIWENSGDLYVGCNGNASMTISDGAKVTNSYGYIGSESDGVGGVTVNGPNSIWENSETLFVSCEQSTSGGTDPLYISNDGTVEANEVIIWYKGVLGGDGKLISDSVTNYGKISVASITTPMTIEGNLTMNPGSIFEVEIDNSGHSDLLIVTGDVNIVGGSVKPISLETINGWKEYTIVEANNITGTFDSIDTALLRTLVLDPHTELGYDVNGYDIDSIILKIGARKFDDPNIAQTVNQRSVGKALQKIAENGGNSITTALQGFETYGQIRSSYDQLCGQTRPQLAPVTIADTSKFMSTVSDRLFHASPSLSNSFSNGPTWAMAGPDVSNADTRTYDTGLDDYMFALGNSTRYFADQKWGLWGKGYGLFGDRKSEGGVPGYKYNVYGTSFGLDYKYTEHSLFGITAGFSDGDVDYTLSGSNSEISGKHIGFYSRSNKNDWFLDYILMYSKLEYETERYINVTSEKANGSFGGGALSGYMEARYDWRSHISWFIQPLASLQFSFLNLDSYTESGSSGNLMFEEQSYKSCKGSVGVRVKNNLYMDAEGCYTTVELRGRLLHEFGDTSSSIGAHFAGNPGSGFEVSDKEISRDSIVLGFGLSHKPNRKLRLFLDYDMSFNADETSHLISAALEYRR